MHHRLAITALLALFVAASPLAAKKPPPPPPLPPLVLDSASPLVTVTIAGQTLRLRVDPASTRHVQLNASAARRLDLANPARLVAGKRADLGLTRTQVGKVDVREATSDDMVSYRGRDLPLTLAWSDRDHVDGADGIIGPRFLPHDMVRWVRRPVATGDVVTHLPMQWESARGMLGSLHVGKRDIDVQIAPAATESIATAAAASYLAESHGGRFDGPTRDIIITMGVVRPVRDLAFDRPVPVAGLRLAHVAVRMFDWSGKTSLPADPAAADEIVVRGRFDAQRQWAKLALGNDLLGKCAAMAWTREPMMIDLTCPGS